MTQCKGQRAEATLDINLEILWVPWFAHLKQLLNFRPCYFWLVVVMMVSKISGVNSGVFLYCADEVHLAFFFILISHPWHFLMRTIFYSSQSDWDEVLPRQVTLLPFILSEKRNPYNCIIKPVSFSIILAYSQEMQ